MVFAHPYKNDVFDFGAPEYNSKIRHYTKDAPLSNEPRGNKHFIYTKGLSGRVRDKEISIDSAVHELYEFTFNMSYSKEHNPDSDEKEGGGVWGGDGTPNYVFVLNILTLNQDVQKCQI